MDYLALTLKRPWPYAIFFLNKDIENRVWVPDPKRLKPKEQFYIHAGSNWDKNGAEWIEYHYGLIPAKSDHPTGIIGRVQYNGWASDHFSDWFIGPKGWLLSDQLQFPEPVDCTGHLNLWPINESLRPQVDAQVKAAKEQQ